MIQYNRQLKKKVAVALSGGVDSAVAMALILKDPTVTDVIGLHMSNWDGRQDDDDNDEGITTCYEQDIKDAEAVCRHLSKNNGCDSRNIPLHKVSFAPEYWANVFEPFVDGIMSGQTPNPDIGCNSMVKFGAMKSYAQKRLDASWIATGHYARLYHRSNHDDNHNHQQQTEEILIATGEAANHERSIQQDVEEIIEKHDWLFKWGVQNPLLLASNDKTKDQSYFLAGVRGESFRNIIFPLGELHKNSTINYNKRSATATTVRQLALDMKLPNATKKESMGICFVGKRRSFKNFLSQYITPSFVKPGNFIDVESGTIVGQHDGAIYYTIGQGAKISGASCKWYVVGRSANNDDNIMVCAGTNHPALYSDELTIENSTMSWIGNSDNIPPDPLLQKQPTTNRNNISSSRSTMLHFKCRTGHLQPLVDCEICLVEKNHREEKNYKNNNNNTPSSSSVIHVRFHQPVRAVTPGQLAAFYVGDICLGGGIIHDVGPSYHELGLEII